MTISREIALPGIGIPTNEKVKDTQKPQKVRLTHEQIGKFMTTTPPELSPGHPVNTPIGNWSMEGNVPVLDLVSSETLERITIPDLNDRRRKLRDKIKTAVKVIGLID